jgi:hypothetical protein
MWVRGLLVVLTQHEEINMYLTEAQVEVIFLQVGAVLELLVEEQLIYDYLVAHETIQQALDLELWLQVEEHTVETVVL